MKQSISDSNIMVKDKSQSICDLLCFKMTLDSTCLSEEVNRISCGRIVQTYVSCLKMVKQTTEEGGAFKVMKV